jgi:hypothetical protein
MRTTKGASPHRRSPLRALPQYTVSSLNQLSNCLSGHYAQNLIVDKPASFPERFADEDILHMLMAPCSERRLPLFESVELMPLQRLDQFNCVD